MFASAAPARLVAALVLVPGTVLALVLPAFGGYDEPLHFLRAWQIADGDLVSYSDRGRDVGGHVPSGLVTDIRALLRDGAFAPGDAGDALRHVDAPAPRGRPVYLSFPTAAVYSPVPYLPSALAVRVGRSLGASTLVLAWLGRVANVAAFAALAALAARRMPARAWLLAAFALVPVAVLQAATFSADGVTYGLALVVFAQAMHLAATDRGAVQVPRLVETAVAALALGLAKQPYVLVAVFLAVPIWRHRGRVGSALAAVLAATGAATLAWARWAEAHYVAPEVALAELDPGTYAYRGVDPDRQLEFLRDHPLDLVAAIGRTLARYGGDIFGEAFAQAPAWRAPTLVAVASLAAAGFVWWRDHGPLPDRRRTAVLGGLVTVAGIGALFTLAYVGWNEVGAPRIDAFQGRYLLPFVALGACALLPARPRAAPSSPREGIELRLAIGAQTLLLAVVTVGLALHFYA